MIKFRDQISHSAFRNFILFFRIFNTTRIMNSTLRTGLIIIRSVGLIFLLHSHFLITIYMILLWVCFRFIELNNSYVNQTFDGTIFFFRKIIILTMVFNSYHVTNVIISSNFTLQLSKTIIVKVFMDRK